MTLKMNFKDGEQIELTGVIKTATDKDFFYVNTKDKTYGYAIDTIDSFLKEE